MGANGSCNLGSFAARQHLLLLLSLRTHQLLLPLFPPYPFSPLSSRAAGWQRLHWSAKSVQLERLIWGCWMGSGALRGW